MYDYFVQNGIKVNNCFINLAHEAGMNIKEDPEMQPIAKEQCNEYADTRDTAIKELRNMIYERGECNPLRTDDAYLLRFLRARNFIVPRAHRMMVRYYAYREQYSHIYHGVNIWDMAKIKGVIQGTYYDNPDMGRLMILKFGCWDPRQIPAEDLLCSAYILAEVTFRQPSLQVIGYTVLVDLEGITFRHVATLTPPIVYQLVSLFGAVNGRGKGCHVINYSWFLKSSVYLFNQLIPRNLLHFHGYDLKSLHMHIDPAYLPPTYGGTCRYHGDFENLIRGLKKYKDAAFEKDMKQLGFVL